MKSVQIRSFFWSVFSCIRTEYRKIKTRKNSMFGRFSCSVLCYFSENLRPFPLMHCIRLLIMTSVTFLHSFSQNSRYFATFVFTSKSSPDMKPLSSIDIALNYSSWQMRPAYTFNFAKFPLFLHVCI